MTSFLDQLESIKAKLADGETEIEEILREVTDIIKQVPPGVDLQQMAAAEQAGASFRDSFCPLVYSIYMGFQEAGFDVARSFDPTKTWMVTQLNMFKGPPPSQQGSG